MDDGNPINNKTEVFMKELQMYCVLEMERDFLLWNNS